MDKSLNLTKSRDYFDPVTVDGRCHIIGCGSVGSFVAMYLVRSGVTSITLYDNDVIEPHNLGNQLYTTDDFGKPKTEALKEYLLKINPDCNIKVRGNYTDQPLTGYVFLCVDNIEVRHKIAKAHRYNNMIKAMFDFRTGTEDASHWAAIWSEPKQVEQFIKSMEFTHEEAKEETTITACGVALGLCTTVAVVAAIGVNNFITYIRSNTLKNVILLNVFKDGGNILAM